MDIAPEHAGTASGMMNFGFALAGLVSPASFGFLVDQTGSWVIPFLASIVLLLMGALLASRLRPDRPFDSQAYVAPLAQARVSVGAEDKPTATVRIASSARSGRPK